MNIDTIIKYFYPLGIFKKEKIVEKEWCTYEYYKLIWINPLSWLFLILAIIYYILKSPFSAISKYKDYIIIEKSFFNKHVDKNAKNIFRQLEKETNIMPDNL